MKYSLLLKLSAHQENFGENGPFNHLNIDELTSQDDLINSIEMMCIDNLNLFNEAVNVSITMPWNRIFEANFDVSSNKLNETVLKKHLKY